MANNMMNVAGSGYPKQNFSFGRSGERFVEALGRTTKGMIEYTVQDLAPRDRSLVRETIVNSVEKRNILNIFWNALHRTNNPRIDEDIKVIRRHASYDGVNGAKMRKAIADELGLRDPSGKNAEFFNMLV